MILGAGLRSNFVSKILMRDYRHKFLWQIYMEVKNTFITKSTKTNIDTDRSSNLITIS